MGRNPARYPTRREFAALLDAHLKRGQHPRTPENRWKPWTNNDFAGAVGVSPNTVANWRNLNSPTLPEDIIPVLDALFEDKEQYAGHNRALREAWERASNLVPDLPLPDPWEPFDQFAQGGLAEAILHQPKAANGENLFYLDATVRFSIAEHVDDERTVLVGLRDAFLAFNGSGYQVAQNTRIGDRAEHPFLEPAAGGFVVRGPTTDGCLDGNPIGDHHLLTIEPGPGRSGTVTISVCVGPRALSYRYAPDPEAEPVPVAQKPNRAAVLALVFGKEMKRDGQGRIIVAQATIRRFTD